LNANYFVRRAIKGVNEYRLLAAVTVGTVATVLLLAGVFLIVIGNLSSVLDRWGKDVQVSCYLRDDIADSTIFQIKSEIEEMEEVASVVFVSKTDALERFGEAIEGMDRILADLDSNPLPASLEVRLIPTYQNPALVKEVASRLSRPEFQDLDYSQEWVERFHTFLALLRLSAIVLGVLLLCAAVFLVSNTIRLAIYARREEIMVIQLVGGTRWFARVPFLVEGAVLGTTGAIVALVLLGVVYRYAFVQLQSSLGILVSEDVINFLPGTVLLGLVGAGLAAGLIGAATSVARSTGEGL
jgi:cell division transport system permease protein